VQLTYCDICHQVISTGKRKHILAVSSAEQKNREYGRYKDFDEEIQQYATNCKKVKLYEICTECKKILEYFFRLRIDELEKTKKEIKKIVITTNNKILKDSEGNG